MSLQEGLLGQGRLFLGLGAARLYLADVLPQDERHPVEGGVQPGRLVVPVRGEPDLEIAACDAFGRLGGLGQGAGDAVADGEAQRAQRGHHGREKNRENGGRPGEVPPDLPGDPGLLALHVVDVDAGPDIEIRARDHFRVGELVRFRAKRLGEDVGHEAAASVGPAIQFPDVVHAVRVGEIVEVLADEFRSRRQGDRGGRLVDEEIARGVVLEPDRIDEPPDEGFALGLGRDGLKGLLQRHGHGVRGGLDLALFPFEHGLLRVPHDRFFQRDGDEGRANERGRRKEDHEANEAEEPEGNRNPTEHGVPPCEGEPQGSYGK